MGLKLRGFKAKLTRKRKNVVPEVVCLSYHIKSEFTDLSPPVDTNREIIELNVQNNTTVSLEHENIINSLISNDNEGITNRFDNLSNDREIVTEPFKPKSILKKFNVEDKISNEVIGENTMNSGNTQLIKDDRNSPTTWMTESHDDNNDFEKSTNTNLTDSKSVNWRNTIVMIPTTDTQNDNNHNLTHDYQENYVIAATEVNDEFKINFRQNSNEQDSESENEEGAESDNEPYSSQATSIFFVPDSPKQPTRNARLIDFSNA